MPMRADDPFRRIVLGGRYGYTIFVRPPAMHTNPWDTFERNALVNGRIAVIDGAVVEPGSPHARQIMMSADPAEWPGTRLPSAGCEFSPPAPATSSQ
jgi:hypothetical protein